MQKNTTAAPAQKFVMTSAARADLLDTFGLTETSSAAEFTAAAESAEERAAGYNCHEAHNARIDARRLREIAAEKTPEPTPAAKQYPRMKKADLYRMLLAGREDMRTAREEYRKACSNATTAELARSVDVTDRAIAHRSAADAIRLKFDRNERAITCDMLRAAIAEYEAAQNLYENATAQIENAQQINSAADAANTEETTEAERAAAEDELYLAQEKQRDTEAAQTRETAAARINEITAGITVMEARAEVLEQHAHPKGLENAKQLRAIVTRYRERVAYIEAEAVEAAHTAANDEYRERIETEASTGPVISNKHGRAASLRTLLTENSAGIFPAHTSLGGYPLYYLDEYQNILCADCASKANAGSEIIGADTYLEGPAMNCEDCNTTIESAYGDPNGQDEEEETEAAVADAVIEAAHIEAHAENMQRAKDAHRAAHAEFEAAFKARRLAVNVACAAGAAQGKHTTPTAIQRAAYIASDKAKARERVAVQRLTQARNAVQRAESDSYLIAMLSA